VDDILGDSARAGAGGVGISKKFRICDSANGCVAGVMIVDMH
jgi:hypothetical protein